MSCCFTPTALVVALAAALPLSAAGCSSSGEGPGSPGAGGAGSGGAGGSVRPGSGGSGAGGASLPGSGGAVGSARDSGAPADSPVAPPGSGGSTGSDAAGGSGAVDAASEPGAATGAVLIYSRTTGFRHDSIPTAVARLGEALRARGFTVEASEDPQVFTRAPGLSRFKGVVLLSTTGKPLGDPGTEALAALEAFTRSGGALAGLHSSTSTEYDPAGPLTRLLGGKFVEHPGGVRMASCHAEGNHPAAAMLPEPFVVRDEIYFMSHLRPDNQVILRCDAVSGSMRLPIAWYREAAAGSGRLFYTALGHGNEDWETRSPKFSSHILPGVLWSLGR